MPDSFSFVGAISTLDALERIGQRTTVAGALDVVLFPDIYRQAREALSSYAPVFVTGLMEMDKTRGEPFLKAEKVAKVG
jgi:hypothetical protein